MRFVCILIVLLVVGSLFPPDAKAAVELWVSPTGSDDNPGTVDLPFATPHAALRHARGMRRLKEPALEGSAHRTPAAESIVLRAL